MQKWFDEYPNQIESMDKTKVRENFIHLGGRYGELDKRTLKFTYKKPISEVESEY